MNTKRIIIIDRALELMEPILENQQIFVEVAVVNVESQRAQLKNKKNIKDLLICYSENGKWDTVFDSVVLKLEKETRLDLLNLNAELEVNALRWMSRLTDNKTLSLNRYNNTLLFWEGLIRNRKIDCVILNDTYHGALHELVLKLAGKHGIPAYSIETISSHNGKTLRYIRNWTDGTFVTLPEDVRINNRAEFSEYIGSLTANLQAAVEGKGLKSLFKRWIPMKDYGSVYLILALLGKSFVQYNIKTSYYYLFKGVYKIKRLLNRLDQMSQSEFPTPGRYVYYPLHFDPEASTMNITQTNDQLLVLQMLNSVAERFNLQLVVKEHPAYTQVSSAVLQHSVSAINRFRSLEFYNQIKGLSKVCIVDTNMNSVELAANSAAVATINGSIMLECLKRRKPVICFSPNTNPVGKFSKSVYRVYDNLSLQAAIESILTCENDCLESDLDDLLESFVFSTTNASSSELKRFYEAIVKKLVFS